MNSRLFDHKVEQSVIKAQLQAVCCPGVHVQESDERLSSLKWLFRVEGGGTCAA